MTLQFQTDIFIPLKCVLSGNNGQWLWKDLDLMSSNKPQVTTCVYFMIEFRFLLLWVAKLDLKLNPSANVAYAREVASEIEGEIFILFRNTCPTTNHVQHHIPNVGGAT